MQSPLRIALVNYLNSKPFLYGLENYPGVSARFKVDLFHPSLCAEVFDRGEVDIALVPVGAIPGLRNHKIITPFGIAADEEVRTVCLFSQEPKETWTKVWLDNHSRTSVLLARLLIEDFYRLQVDYAPLNIDKIDLKKGEAVLMIGDKVFDYEKNFSFKIDLADAWKQWTGLPFVFAAWVASPALSKEDEKVLSDILDFGIQHIPDVIQNYGDLNPLLSQYYRHYIRYFLDESYAQGMSKFLQKITKPGFIQL